MSELRANTISDTAGTGPVTLTKQIAAKAWCNVDRSAASIRDSFNISGVTDNGTGDFTQSFTSSFANDDYATGAVTANNGSGTSATSMANAGYWTTGSHRWESWYYNSTKYDDTYAQNVYVGDLA